MKLISMTCFVLEQLKVHQSTSEFKEVVKNYANFLNQPLTLGMFVPCDFEGNPLKEPRDLKRYNDMFLRNEQVQSDWMAECLFYEQAKEWVLFEGFKLIKNSTHYEPYIVQGDGGFWWYVDDLNSISIEQLVKYSPKLSESAIKLIGL